MRLGATLTLLLGLLLLPGAAEAAADTNPFARCSTLEAPPLIEPLALVVPKEKKQAPLVGTALWLPMREAQTALTPRPPLLAPLAADGFRFVQWKETSVVLRATPLSLSLSWTPFPPSRTRSPLEPLYPRFW